MSLTEDLDKAIKDIEVKFKGGLSNTSTNKFNDLSVVISALTGLPEDDIYITSVYARPSNTWNRLSQGKPLARHYTLGVCIASPDGVNGVLAPLGSFIGDGNVHYDNIAVVAQNGDSVWRIKAIATNAKDAVSIKCQDEFSDSIIKLVNPVANYVEEVVKRSINPNAVSTPSPVGATNRIEGALQLIIYGAPGTGKSWRIKNDTKGCKVIRTTFHPDSDYSTFVGAYKPSMEADEYDTVVTTGERSPGGNISKKDGLVRQKRIVYKFVAQAFLKAYVAAWKKMADADDGGQGAARPTVCLVIEEINRGNCAQIFGDLFQLLDRDDYGFSDYEIAADEDLRRYLAEAFKGVNRSDAMNCVPPEIAEKLERIFKGEILLLPPNLYIWATMNTSDQSLFPIDSAFKRRWAWKYIPISNAGKNYSIEVGRDKYDWWTFLEKANDLVQSFTESEDKKLGYFFCKADRNGVISLEQFVGKVVFYLWNGVFKDTGFDDEVFDDGKGGKLYFKRFFDAKGDPNPESVRQFMKNLGVGAVASSAGNAEGADEGTTTEPPAGDAENMEGQGQ